MRFVILAAHRTGSTHLSSLLQHYDNILCNGEIFHKDGVFLRWPAGKLSPDLREEMARTRAASPIEFMHRVLGEGFGSEHVGFKLLFGQNKAAFDSVMGDRSIKKIVLLRQNFLASYASFIAASTTGTWHDRSSGKEKSSAKKTPLLFQRDDFIQFSRTRGRVYGRTLRELNKSGQNYCLINYEELNDMFLVGRVITFVTEKPFVSMPKSSTSKLSSSNIVSRYSNQDEVYAFLEEHGLMHWSHEGEIHLSGQFGDGTTNQIASQKANLGDDGVVETRASAAAGSTPALAGGSAQ